MAGNDRIIRFEGEISGTFLQIGLTQLADLEPGATVSTSTATSTSVGPSYTITPHPASTLIAQDDLIEELMLTYQRLGGGTWAVLFDLAICTEWSLEGPDNDEGQVSATFRPRLRQTLAAASLNTCPWKYVITDPPA